MTTRKANFAHYALGTILLDKGLLHLLSEPLVAGLCHPPSCARASAIASVFTSSAVQSGDFRRIIDDYDKAIDVQLADPKRYKAVQVEPDAPQQGLKPAAPNKKRASFAL